MNVRTLTAVASSLLPVINKNSILIDYFNPKERKYTVKVGNTSRVLYGGERLKATSADELFSFFLNSSRTAGDRLTFVEYKQDTYAITGGVIIKNNHPLYVVIRNSSSVLEAFLDVTALTGKKDTVMSFILKKLIPTHLSRNVNNVKIQYLSDAQTPNVGMYKESEIEDVLLKGIDSIY